MPIVAKLVWKSCIRSLQINSMQSQRKNRVDLDPSESCGVGCIVSLGESQNPDILKLGLTSLANVAHRGAIGADGKTGDGCGVMTDIPSDLLSRWLREANIVSDSEWIGVGCAFLPTDAVQYQSAIEMIRSIIDSEGMKYLGLREVPTESACLGSESRRRKPNIVQFFVSAATDDPDELDRRLFIVRRYIELNPRFGELDGLHIASLSCRKIVYKGMVQSGALSTLYPDLADPDYNCRVCVYHQRFSTNTSPDWERCQPFRMVAHNGEINTIRGNRNWMTARESSFDHEYWNEHRHVVSRLFNFRDSDSASLDNCVELLTLSGRELEHSLAMLIPAVWHNDPRISETIRAFYEFHSCFCEPWDGPAAVVAFDGNQVVATLDRNGLRPLRYKVSKQGVVIIGSEVGSDRVPLENISEYGRLGPGQSLAINLKQGRVIFDRELKTGIANKQPYDAWLAQNRIEFKPRIHGQAVTKIFDQEFDFLRHQMAAGLTREEVDLSIRPMATDGVEPTFSMGVDTPLAVLSRHPRNLADYFKQRFAQVTNPPIDPIRERLSMSLAAGLGPERNILRESPRHCRILSIENPVLLPHEFQQLKDEMPFGFTELNCTFETKAGPSGLQVRLDQLIAEACLAVENQSVVLILSDKGVGPERAAVPMLLAVGAIHHGLQTNGQRMMASLVAETSDVRDAHQLALLFGYGCTAVFPWLAHGTIEQLVANQKIKDLPVADCQENFRQALNKGLLKVMSKMGISVLNSYQGAQIFEAIGLGEEVIDKCFKYSLNNLAGIGFKEIAEDCLVRHELAFNTDSENLKYLEPGISKPKRAGEHHVINGKVTKNIHRFVNNNESDDYSSFVDSLESERPVSVRDLFDLQPLAAPLPISEVEPIESIRTRFTTAAMSLGAISPEAHEALAIAMNEIGGKSNSGEGGEDARRFQVQSNGIDANSKIKQVASGRFGVDAGYLNSAEEIEIKMAQGAKPGEGGQLPGFKVNELIARLRNTSPGVTLISPPPHHDIYSIEDLAQLIYDLKQVNPKARVCVKLVAKSGVGGIAVGVVKSYADVVLISGHEGGTGASPLTSIKHAGLPWELGLAETHQSLVASHLRDRVILRADGGMRSGLDIVKAAVLGAEEFNFGTMALIALGCVYVKKCHLNNCPVGIATQDPKYRERFKGKPANLVNYMNAIATECRSILASLGIPTMDALVGRLELLKRRPLDDRKIASLDTVELTTVPDQLATPVTTQSKYATPPKTEPSFDDRIIRLLSDHGNELNFDGEIDNANRNIGTKLSGELIRRKRENRVVCESITLNLRGSAGQSLGSFLGPGISVHVRGEANDYVGKGMSGGRIILSRANRDDEQEMVIAGNAVLYGATGGELFAAGTVAERFCVRNSGALAVVEGCGDHGCEYMTRGTAIILGKVGNNFGAGMTGGQAFVFDSKERLEKLCNLDSVMIGDLDAESRSRIKEQINTFAELTASRTAIRIVKNWSEQSNQIYRVSPVQVSGLVSGVASKTMA